MEQNGSVSERVCERDEWRGRSGERCERNKDANDENKVLLQFLSVSLDNRQSHYYNFWGLVRDLDLSSEYDVWTAIILKYFTTVSNGWRRRRDAARPLQKQ